MLIWSRRVYCFDCWARSKRERQSQQACFLETQINVSSSTAKRFLRSSDSEINTFPTVFFEWNKEEEDDRLLLQPAFWATSFFSFYLVVCFGVIEASWWMNLARCLWNWRIKFSRCCVERREKVHRLTAYCTISKQFETLTIIIDRLDYCIALHLCYVSIDDLDLFKLELFVIVKTHDLIYHLSSICSTSRWCVQKQIRLCGKRWKMRARFSAAGKTFSGSMNIYIGCLISRDTHNYITLWGRLKVDQMATTNVAMKFSRSIQLEKYIDSNL